MSFLPYESITYKTKLGYGEITERIKNAIEPKKFIRIIKGNTKKAYEGKVQENKFLINRIMTFTNVFSPGIHGTIINENDEVKINIKFKLQTMVIAVLVVWLGLVVCVLFSSLINLFIHDVSNRNWLTALLILAVGCVMMIGAFKSECEKEKKMLEELLELTSP